MASLNRVQIIGNCGRDPEIRTFESGNKIATFTVAVSERYTDRDGQAQESTEWFNIVANNKLADLAESYINKGMSLYIEGKQKTRSYTDVNGVKKYLTEVVAMTIQMLSKPQQSQDPYIAGAQAQARTQAPQAPQPRPVAPPRPAAPAPQAPTPRPTYSQPAPQFEQAPMPTYDDLPFGNEI